MHCAELGWPIVGDAIYGTAPRVAGPGLHLHAREIVVPLYKNRAPIRVVAPVPDHMRERLVACGWGGEEDQGSRACHSGDRANGPARSGRPDDKLREEPESITTVRENSALTVRWIPDSRFRVTRNDDQ